MAKEKGMSSKGCMNSQLKAQAMGMYNKTVICEIIDKNVEIAHTVNVKLNLIFSTALRWREVYGKGGFIFCYHRRRKW